ncbi:hypothetical protein RIF29_24852 [Crotalaria pallida]|uniref:Uncharacterized protein n=1 Tax=Crotalaria pallida TaxID=3830 RepID=A0AAN9EMR2_CROPI
MGKFVEDPVVNLDDDNSAYDESSGEEHDELGDKNGPAEINASDYQYKRITDLTADDILGLEFGTYTIHTSSVQDIGDPTMVKTKGAPRKRKDSKKRRRCSHCNNVGHTISTCPKRLSENDQYTKNDNLAPSNSLASDSEHDNDKEGNQHDEDKLQPSMPKNQSKTAKDKGFQPNMTSGGYMPAFVQGIHPYPSLSGVRPEIPQGVYGFPHYGHGVASQGLSPFLPYVGYPFFNQNLHHHSVYQQFPQVRRMSINNYSTFTYPKAKLRLPT